MTISTAVHLQNRQVQADDGEVDRMMCHAVSVTDAAVEVGESLLALDSKRHNGEIAQTLSLIAVSSVTAKSVQSSPVCIAAAAAAMQQDAVREPLADVAVTSRNMLCRQQPDSNMILEQRPDHDTGASCHISESAPAIVIVPDESTSPGYHLSCDERSSFENSVELTGPLDNLAQPEICLPAERVVCYAVTC